LNALGIIYPQYKLQENVEVNFNKHLEILKEVHGNVKKISGMMPPLLNVRHLDLQTFLFKVTMKNNDNLP
jgi:hypothetical protein